MQLPPERVHWPLEGVNDPDPLTRLKVTVPVGDEPLTTARHGAPGPMTTKGGHVSVVVVDTA